MMIGSLAGARMMGFLPLFWALPALVLLPARPSLTASVAGHWLVKGTVEHRQFGEFPRSEVWHFTVRSAGRAWSFMAEEQRPGRAVDRVLAVGNEDGVFITLDFPSAVRQLRAANQPSGPNTAQALVQSDPVPNSVLTPVLGPVWMTFLSAAFFDYANPEGMPPPTLLNIAAGNPIPPGVHYVQRAWWTRDTNTGLPLRFTSADDGVIRGIVGGRLVETGRYPPPNESGITNLLFVVEETGTFGGLRLPIASRLQVYWLPAYWRGPSQPEIIHEFAVRAESFAEPPPFPIPDPAPTGLTLVTDVRAVTSAGPVLVDYIATNRFLSESELRQLPAFNYAVERSLAGGPLEQTGPRRHIILGLLLLLLLLLPYAVRIGRRIPPS